MCGRLIIIAGSLCIRSNDAVCGRLIVIAGSLCVHSNDAVDCVCVADAVLAEAFERAQSQSSLSVLSNGFLVHLGLIKVTIIALSFSSLFSGSSHLTLNLPVVFLSAILRDDNNVNILSSGFCTECTTFLL